MYRIFQVPETVEQFDELYTKNNTEAKLFILRELRFAKKQREAQNKYQKKHRDEIKAQKLEPTVDPPTVQETVKPQETVTPVKPQDPPVNPAPPVKHQTTVNITQLLQHTPVNSQQSQYPAIITNSKIIKNKKPN